MTPRRGDEKPRHSNHFGHTFRLAGSPTNPLRACGQSQRSFAACGQSRRSFAGFRAIPEILCGLNDSESRFFLVYWSWAVYIRRGFYYASSGFWSLDQNPVGATRTSNVGAEAGYFEVFRQKCFLIFLGSWVERWVVYVFIDLKCVYRTCETEIRRPISLTDCGGVLINHTDICCIQGTLSLPRPK